MSLFLGWKRSSQRVSWSSTRARLTLCLAALAALGAAAGAVWLSHRPGNAAVDRLVQACELEMLRGVCRVQTGPAASAPLENSVFVAGVGAIDAASFQRLQGAGQALCSTVRADCNRSWTSADCRAARALHGQP